MIKINISNGVLEMIKTEYLRKINGKTFRPKQRNAMHDFWFEKKDDIITADPEKLNAFISDFNALGADQEVFIVFKKYMANLYDNRVDKLWLMKELKINTCHYCNRQYTFTVEKARSVQDENNIKPQFDHFFPKSKYPYLALSFYNLIPSCPTCNIVKQEAEIGVNPYQSGFDDTGCGFILLDKHTNLSPVAYNSDIKIVFQNANANTQKNISVFGLEELYNEHMDYVGEIINKAMAYTNGYYESLIHSFQGLGHTPPEIERYVWGVYLEMADYGNRPLSKLTRDVLNQIGIKRNNC